MKLNPWLFLFLSLNACASKPAAMLSTDPTGFVVVTELDPTILTESRYAGAYNFIGVPIRGYKTGNCRLSRQAAEALVKVQANLKTKGYRLKTHDCYRPQKAVNHFIEWAKDLSDQKMKKDFYPEVPKEEIFARGYVASKSGHSRGSTVDLTMVKIGREKEPLDMGTPYDFFSEKSWTAAASISPAAGKNRMLLVEAMEAGGFRNYDKEWWHYTLKSEPFPDTYFDFDN